jgi:hypothetical protein
MIVRVAGRFDAARCGRTSAPIAELREFPPRPDRRVFNEAIPLFHIGRSRNGFWVAREEKSRIGGLFFLRRSALRFAARNSGPAGRATMLLTQRFELDLANDGNLLAGAVDSAVRVAARLARRFAASIVTALAAGRKFLMRRVVVEGERS